MKENILKIKHLISIKSIEIEVGCPTDTLQKWMQGKQGLPKKWEQPLKDFLISFAQSILDCV